MHITANRSPENTLLWKVWEICSNAANRVAKASQPVFEKLSWVASGLCSLAKPAINASISIGKLATSKTFLTVSLLAVALASGASTPSSKPTMVPPNISDFLINMYTNGYQWDPSTATFPDDSFVVTWDRVGLGDSNGVFGQRFFANGSARGSEFRANTYTNGSQYYPSTAAFSDGSFVVTWIGEGIQGSSDYDIYGKCFNMFGQPIPWRGELLFLLQPFLSRLLLAISIPLPFLLLTPSTPLPIPLLN